MARPQCMTHTPCFTGNKGQENMIDASYILKQTWCPSVCVDKNWAVQGQTGQGRAGQGGRGRAGRPGKKTWEILGYGFQDMVFRTWDLNFGAWEILGYGFQDLGSQLWGLDFHTHGFQDRNLKTFRT